MTIRGHVKMQALQILGPEQCNTERYRREMD